MDTDNQIPLKFLDEAEDCCDRLEATVLGLAETIADPQKLDEALRAAHSVKGGAAMMGFITLSQVSHQLEDYFKILRVRYQTNSISMEIETLLLQGIDRLRHAIDLHRRGGALDIAEFSTQSQPIFDRLRQQLGELRPEDEDALLSQESDVNPAILMFESGVKEALDFLAARLDRLAPGEVLQEVAATAAQLSDFGRMAKLDRFIDLCASVQSQSQITDLAGAMPLARRSLKLWRKSHAVVLLGRFEQIPDRLPTTQAAPPPVESLTDDRFNPTLAGMEGIVDLAAVDFALLQSEIVDLDSPVPTELLGDLTVPIDRNWDDADLQPDFAFSDLPALELLSELAAFDLSDSIATAIVNSDDADPQPDFAFSDLPSLELLSELAAVDLSDSIATAIAPERDADPQPDFAFSDLPSPELLSELAAFDLFDSLDPVVTNWDNTPSPPDVDRSFFDVPPLELLDELAALAADAPPVVVTDGDEIADRPSFALLDELAAIRQSRCFANELPELPTRAAEEPQRPEIVTPSIDPAPTPQTSANRQTVRVPVEYLQQFNRVFGKLVLERNAINLRLQEIQNYTRLLRTRMQNLESSNKELRQWYDRASTEGTIANPDLDRSAVSQNLAIGNPATPNEFDLLELDRYSDLHLVSQSQIETIVQLQEVTADIELSLREMTHSVGSLNQTTRTMQSNLTRTQMLPFADVVKRFPRLIRDLSVQFDKSVDLKIGGEHTGIDRSMLDSLSDPLIHLLRNAFDHGIEDLVTRLAAGKSARGTIEIAASQRGGETVITIADDGGGIRLDRIRQRLEQMGLPNIEVARMSETDLLDTIFEPGFSTSTSLTELSGRGVGMDVVRTNIERIGGTIRVHTQAGVGTKFTIRVPFIRSIVRVMLLERAGFVFAVSIDSIRETIAYQPDLLTADGQNIAWQSQVIPLISLEQGLSFGRNQRALELPGTPTISKPTVLIVGEDDRSIAFRIDRFWGEREVTRRAIDSLMPLTPGFGNSIILGDGRVVPALDLIQLADWMATTVKSLANLNLTPVVMPVAIDRTQPATILVVDDSINVRRYLAAMLEKEGYRVEQAKDGREAVEKLSGGLTVQAVLCDIEMPRLDGYGVLEALRSTEIFEDLPIVMLTSRSSDKHRQLAMNLGASAYFSKPYTEPDLLAALRSAIATSPHAIEY